MIDIKNSAPMAEQLHENIIVDELIFVSGYQASYIELKNQAKKKFPSAKLNFDYAVVTSGHIIVVFFTDGGTVVREHHEVS